MSIEATIKGIISKLSPEWFTAVKDEFESNSFYDEKSETIDDVIEEYQLLWDPEISEEGEDKSNQQIKTIVIQSTLPEYSWRGLPIYLSNINPEEEPIYKANSLTSEIIDSIDVLFDALTDLKDKHQLIVSAVQYMQEEANTQKGKLKDQDYHDSIDHCILQFRYELSRKYAVIKSAHDTINEFEDKLVFDISQKELAFLLAVLMNAGFLYGSNEKGSTINHFFSKYFYFKNQREGNAFTRATTINKKISEAMSSGNADYIKIKPDIKKRLIAAIDSL